MCLACEMDALWYDEMDAAVLRARQSRLEQAGRDEPPADQAASAGPTAPRPASGFVCEEIVPE
jgi:hypothetical protein